MTDWFRSWHGAPTDPKWLLIGRKAGVAPGIVSAVVWALMDAASQADERGSIKRFDAETYAAFAGFDETDVQAVLDALEEKGIVEDGRLSAWDRRQPKREDGSAERGKVWRERNRTQPNATERQSRVDIDTEAPNGANRASASAPTPRDELETVLDADHADAVLEHRQRIRKPLTARAAKLLAGKFGQWPEPNDAADAMVANGWIGFEVSWMANRERAQSPPRSALMTSAERWLNEGNDGQASETGFDGNVELLPPGEGRH